MKKQLACVGLAAALALTTLAGCGSSSSSSSSSSSKASSKNYKPVTIEMNLERSGLGKNYKHTFKKMPTKVVADGDQMADIFFDLGLADNMAGYRKVGASGFGIGSALYKPGKSVDAVRQSAVEFAEAYRAAG